MQKWEYCQLETRGVAREVTILYHTQNKSEQHLGFSTAMKKLGIEGWELVSILNYGESRSFYFKRPLQSVHGQG